MASGIDRARLAAGLILSGKSIRVLFGSAGPFDGMMKASHEESRTRKPIKGSRPDGGPIGLTAGEYEPGKLSFDFAATTLQVIKEQLATLDPNGTSYGDSAGFTTQITLVEPLSSGPPIIFTFAGCWYESDKGDYPTDAEALKPSFGVGYLTADANGLTLISSQT
jgi:hypothetical protein